MAGCGWRCIAVGGGDTVAKSTKERESEDDEKKG